MENLLHENSYTSISVFCGKASFISKQPEKSSQGVHNRKLVGGNTQLHIHWQGLSRESRPIPAQFPLQVETEKVDSKMPLMSKHTYFRKEDTWSQLN